MPAESGMFLFDFAGGISPRGFWKKPTNHGKKFLYGTN